MHRPNRHADILFANFGAANRQPTHRFPNQTLRPELPPQGLLNTRAGGAN